MVKRYNPYSAIDLSVWIVEDPQGQLIMSADYDALAAELAAVRKTLQSDWFSRVTYKQQRDTAHARIRELEAIIARNDTTESYKCNECGAWHVRAVKLEAGLRAFIPPGIEDVCDDCGGDAAKCGQGCPVWDARALLSPAAETKCPQCVYDVRNPDVCERCGTARATSETPAKYGSCPECSGQGGGHFTSCSHSPTKISSEHQP